MYSYRLYIYFCNDLFDLYVFFYIVTEPTISVIDFVGHQFDMNVTFKAKLSSDYSCLMLLFKNGWC